MSGSSWFNANYKYRWPVAVDITGGGGSSGTYDVEIIISSKWDAFWNNINSNGYDIIPVDANGNALTFARHGYNYANKTLTIQIDGLSVENNDAIHLVYLYWGHSTAPDTSSSVTITSPKAGIIFLGKPTNMVAADAQNTQGDESAAASFAKPAEQKSYVWFRFSPNMSKRISTYNKFLFYEGISYVQPSVWFPTGPTEVPAMVDLNKTRFIPGWIGVFVQEGNNDQDYLIRCDTVTTENQTFSFRATLQIRNQFPAVR